MQPRAVIFDAYGTLFDVHTVVTRGGGIDGDVRALSHCGGSDSSNTHGSGLSWIDTKTFGVSRKLRYDRPPDSFGSP